MTMKRAELLDHLRYDHHLADETILAFETLEEAHETDHQPWIGQTHEHSVNGGPQ